MVQTLTPRMLRGFSWVWVSATLLAIVPQAVHGQGAAGKADAKKSEAPAKKAAEGEGADDDVAVTPGGSGIVDTHEMKKQESIELFKDPRSEKAIVNKFEELPYPAARALTPYEVSSLKNMAAGLAGPDRVLMTRAVDIQIAEMTNRTNIKYVIDPPKLAPGSTAFRGETYRSIERASQLLMDLLLIAKEKKNDVFLSAYIPILFAKLTPLLNNHLYPRIQASIVLAEAATPTTIDLFTKQISDPNQTIWVKLWSARGLTNATNRGRVTLDVVKATAAVATILSFLDKESNAPWPVKVRMIEALGYLRLASPTGPQGKPEVLSNNVKVLADPKNKLELRAWAAWTLGMIPVPAAQSSYNFSLEAYQIGRLAAEIADGIGGEFDKREKNFAKQSDHARFLAGLLIYQVAPALAGEPDVQNSGLLNMRHPSIATAQPLIKGVDEYVKKLSQDAVELLRAGGADMKGARTTLGTRVAELNSFLDKNRPADAPLYPGGPKLPAATGASVAGGPTPPPAK